MSLLIHDSPTSRQISSWSGVSAMNHSDRISSHCTGWQTFPKRAQAVMGWACFPTTQGIVFLNLWDWDGAWHSTNITDLGSKGLRDAALHKRSWKQNSVQHSCDGHEQAACPTHRGREVIKALRDCLGTRELTWRGLSCMEMVTCKTHNSRDRVWTAWRCPCAKHTQPRLVGFVIKALL